jgi:DNA helicase-2/ATP-dependent DNA helicase PcrA
MTIQDRINQAPMPIIITASAGTGKTYCLTKKIEYMIQNGINPLNILAFTFTVDAANELRQRIQGSELMTVGTIHSIALQVIREHSTKKYFVLKDFEQRKYVFDLFKEMRIDFDRYNAYMGKIGFAKNKYIDYYEMLDGNQSHLCELMGEKMAWAEFAYQYEAKKEQMHKIDFDDMAPFAVKILKENKHILDSRQERWKYIFVDEAQDLCPPQAEFIELLGAKYKNVLAVGDIKQAIYGSFRASSPEFMLQFGDIFSNAQYFELPTTYRCSEKICDAGNKIASYIDHTVINTANKTTGEIEFPETFDTQSDEATWIVEKAGDYLNNTEKSIKILYRTNAQSLMFQLELIRNGIPYSINQTNSLFNTKEGRIALAVCDLMLNTEATPKERVEIVNVLRPLIQNKKGIYKLIDECKKRNIDPFNGSESMYFLNDDSMQTRHELLALVKSLKENSPSNIPSRHISAVSVMLPEDIMGENAKDNLQGIAEFLSGCQTMQEINDMIAEISKPRNNPEGARVVSLSTIHGSKGLEADIVFLSGVADNLFPHQRGLQDEELNLMYVGVTRAKEKLFVTSFYRFGTREYDKMSYRELIR